MQNICARCISLLVSESTDIIYRVGIRTENKDSSSKLLYMCGADRYVNLTKEIQPRDLFVIWKVKAQNQAQTDGTGSVDVSKSESHLSRQSCAKYVWFDFDAKNRLQLIQNLMAHEG